MLARLAPGSPPMQPVTAFCLIAAAGALFLRSRFAGDRIRSGTVPTLLAGLVAAIALLTLVLAHPVGGAGVPGWLAASLPGPPGPDRPGRMAVGTALSLLPLAAALLAVGERRRGAVPWLATAGLVTPLLGGTGWLYGIQPLNGLAVIAGMALPTTVSLLALAVGTLALVPERGWVVRLVGEDAGAVTARSLLPWAVLGSLAAVWLLYHGGEIGLYGTDFRAMLVTVVSIFVVSAVILAHAGRLSRADGQLRESRELFASVADTQPGFVFVADAYGRNTFTNKQLQSFTGLPAADLLGDRWLRALHPDDRRRAAHIWMAAVRGGSGYEAEYRFRRHDGAWRRFLCRGTPVRAMPGGPVLRWVGVCTDVEDRRQAETRILAERDRAQVILLVLDRSGRIETINRYGAGLLGHADETVLVGRDWFDLAIPEPDRQQVRAIFARFAAGTEDAPEAAEGGILCADGKLRLIAWRNTRLVDGAGRFSGTISCGVDITRLRQDEIALARQESLLRGIAEGTADLIAAVDRDYRFLFFNEPYRRELRILWGREIQVGMSLMDVLAPWPEEQRKAKDYWDRALAGETFSEIVEFGPTAETTRVYDLRFSPVPGPGGRRLGAAHIFHDVTEQRRMQEMLHRVVEGAPFPMMVHADDGGVLHLSSTWRELTGYDTQDIATIADWATRAYPERVEMVMAEIARLYDLEAPRDEGDYILQTKDGRSLVWSFRSAPVGRDPQGRRLVVSMAADLTDQRQAEARLHLLMREVDHRAKNVLAVVQAVVRLTRAADPADFVAAVDGRIAAMARAHSLLAVSGWAGVDLRRMATDELAAWDQGNRVLLSGPPIAVRAEAAQAVSLALHELTTNAAKYGALSTPGGTLSLDWRVGDGHLHLDWRERGGPPLAGPPTSRGFGTELLHGTVTRQLGGELTQTWNPAGLDCALILPPDTWEAGEIAVSSHRSSHTSAGQSPGYSRPRPLADAVTILLAEDEPLTGQMIRRSLEDAGYRVVGPAARVPEALGLIARHRIDAAVLDARLYDNFVTPVAAALAAMEVTFLLCSGYGSRTGLPPALAAVPLLPKPVRVDGLLDALGGLLREGQGR
ncbi:MAG: hypothetical protein RLY86_1322 [Pseudomonadota bacterium]|jgi:PAS domain S-box-containing protein